MSKTSLLILTALLSISSTFPVYAQKDCNELAGTRNGVWFEKDEGDPYTCRYRAQIVSTFDGSNATIQINFSEPNLPRLCKESGEVTLAGICSNGQLSLNDGFSGSVSEYLLRVENSEGSQQGYFFLNQNRNRR